MDGDKQLMKTLTVVCPAALQAQANLVWFITDSGIGGERTFTEGYNTDGSDTPTCFISSGAYPDNYAIVMAKLAGTVWAGVQQLAADHGRTIPFTKAQFVWAWPQLQISAPDADPLAYIASLGLVRVGSTQVTLP